MAATIGTLTMRGQPSKAFPKGKPYVLSIYNPAAAAAGSYVLMDWNAPASANSPNFFTVPELVDVMDFLPGAASGMIEFTSDGKRTQVVLDYAVWQPTTTGGRPVSQLPQLGPGKLYRFLVVSALAA